MDILLPGEIWVALPQEKLTSIPRFSQNICSSSQQSNFLLLDFVSIFWDIFLTWCTEDPISLSSWLRSVRGTRASLQDASRLHCEKLVYHLINAAIVRLWRMGSARTGWQMAVFNEPRWHLHHSLTLRHRPRWRWHYLWHFRWEKWHLHSFRWKQLGLSTMTRGWTRW